jgi:DNA polymerase-3 subunit delta
MFTAEPGADWSKLAANAANLSLFATKKLLEIRIPTGKPGADGGKAIEALCARLPEDTVVLVMLPSWRQFKTAWFGALENGPARSWAKAISARNSAVARRALRLQRQHASVETLEWMADRVEGNLLAAKQEVEKLTAAARGRDLLEDSARR